MNPHEQFIVSWNLVFTFNLIIKINTSQSTICMHLNSLAFNIFASKSLLTVFFQIKSNLVPSFIQLQRHRTLKWLYPCYWLIIWTNKCSFYILVIKHCHLKTEILVELNHKGNTFLAKRTKIGIRIFIELFLALGNEIKFCWMLLPAI